MAWHDTIRYTSRRIASHSIASHSITVENNNPNYDDDDDDDDDILGLVFVNLNNSIIIMSTITR